MSEAEMQSRRLRGEGVEFDRIRRITGYLAGTLKRFNPAKLAEVNERTKNNTMETNMAFANVKTGVA